MKIFLSLCLILLNFVSLNTHAAEITYEYTDVFSLNTSLSGINGRSRNSLITEDQQTSASSVFSIDGFDSSLGELTYANFSLSSTINSQFSGRAKRWFAFGQYGVHNLKITTSLNISTITNAPDILKNSPSPFIGGTCGSGTSCVKEDSGAYNFDAVVSYPASSQNLSNFVDVSSLELTALMLFEATFSGKGDYESNYTNASWDHTNLIVSYGYTPTPTSVPAPMPIWLFASGLITILISRRKTPRQ